MDQSPQEHEPERGLASETDDQASPWRDYAIMGIIFGVGLLLILIGMPIWVAFILP